MVSPFSSNGTLATSRLPSRVFEVALDHLPHHIWARRSWASSPTSPAPCWHRRSRRSLPWAGNTLDRCEPQFCRDFLSTPFYTDTLAAPFDATAHFGKCAVLQIRGHRGRFAGGQHKIVGSFGLQDHVHALDIVPRMAPVALGFEIAKIKRLVEADLDAGDAAGYLAGDKRLAADRAFVVEQNAVEGFSGVFAKAVICGPRSPTGNTGFAFYPYESPNDNLFRVLFFGRVQEYKGLRHLIDKLERYGQRMPIHHLPVHLQEGFSSRRSRHQLGNCLQPGQDRLTVARLITVAACPTTPSPLKSWSQPSLNRF